MSSDLQDERFINKGKLCWVCRQRPATIKGRCHRCDTYQRKQGQERPRHLAQIPDGVIGTHEVAKLVGASFRQLDHWWRTGRIPHAKNKGGGVPRFWTSVQIEAAQDLLAAIAACPVCFDRSARAKKAADARKKRLKEQAVR